MKFVNTKIDVIPKKTFSWEPKLTPPSATRQEELIKGLSITGFKHGLTLCHEKYKLWKSKHPVYGLKLKTLSYQSFPAFGVVQWLHANRIHAWYIYIYIYSLTEWLMIMVNVGSYTIHGSYGMW